MSPRRFLILLLLVALGCSDTAAPASKLPAQPDGVLATAGTSRITISWRDVGASEKKYVVEVSSGGGLWLPLAETAASVTQVVHADVEHGVVYRYRVKACNDAGCSDWVETSGRWEGGAPPSAAAVIVRPISSSYATLNASAESGGLTSVFTFYAREAGAEQFTPYPSVTSTPISGDKFEVRPVSAAFVAFGLKPQTDYEVYVQVQNAVGRTASEVTTFRTIGNGPPSFVGQLRASPEPPALILTAQVNVNGLPTELRFDIALASGSLAVPVVSQKETRLPGIFSTNFSIPLSALQSATDYKWRVRAENSAGVVFSDSAFFRTP